jgi:peptide/nickel transport system permease protein
MTTPHQTPIEPIVETESLVEERISVASNWTLVWWRFRKHHLAMASAAILIALYAIVLCPDFFSTQDPEFTEARQAFIPVQGVNFIDEGRLDPWVPAIVGKRNPVTLRMEWRTDASQKVRVGFFVAGTEYKFLGLFKSNLHLIGARDQSQRIFLLGSDRLGRDQGLARTARFGSGRASPRAAGYRLHRASVLLARSQDHGPDGSRPAR